MMRISFGVLLGLFVIYPSLLGVVLAVAAWIAAQPAVLAFAVGVIIWPRISRRITRWAR